jgi:hypothetical protein
MAETFPTQAVILLDSGSTTDIISNPKLLHDIQDATKPIWIGSIAGRINLTKQGYLGEYPFPVWYNPDGVANILSLFNVLRSNRVTMDTKKSQTIRVHMNDGSSIDFRPTGNGLWVHHIDNVQHVQNMWSMLSTVSNKKQLYTKRACKRAVMACRLQNIIMRTSTWKYQDLIIDHMGDCPVTQADIQAAEDIFGPNLSSLKGKTVQQLNPHVSMGVDPIARNTKYISHCDDCN